MSYDQMVGKMLESTSVVPGNLLKLPWTMAEDQIARMEDGLTLLTQTNLYVCRLFDLIKLEAAILQCRPILVIVDYIQLYREPSSWRGSRADYITMVAGEMAKLSRKYKTIFMVLCQLNRRGVDDPDSHNLKDAGGIEEAADSIWILSRPDKDEESRISLKTIIGVRKNRMGVEFDEDLLFDGETQRFVPWDETEAEKFWLRRLKHMRDLT
jgi:replicative DNA helicase